MNNFLDMSCDGLKKNRGKFLQNRANFAQIIILYKILFIK